MREQPGDEGSDPTEEVRRQAVADGLRDAFTALAGPDVPPEDRPRWHTRLIAITSSSKHDLPTAERRLERWWEEWEAEVGPRP